MRSLTINKNNIMKNSLFLPVILFLVMILINSVMQPNLFKASVIRSNILTFSPLILVAMGQSIIMIAGNLDLSVGFGVSLLNCFLAMTLRVEPGQGGYNTLILGLGLLIAVVMGVVNGFIVGYLKIPSFIATFATSFIGGVRP